MTENSNDSKKDWVDPDDAPEWTDERFDRAQFSDGRKVLRKASGT